MTKDSDHNRPAPASDPSGGKRLLLTRRRLLLGTALGAGAVLAGYGLLAGGQYRAETADRSVDVLLIGGGIMSATLGVLINELEPEWTLELFERLDTVAGESSNGWNNAGTGHSALCELNYTPEDGEGNVQISRAINIAEQFQVSRQFWAHQVERGVLKDPRSFINSTPHMNLVWGEENVADLSNMHGLRHAYAQMRYEALTGWKSPFAGGPEPAWRERPAG